MEIIQISNESSQYNQVLDLLQLYLSGFRGFVR